jgi:hypothetical protein
MDNSAPTSWWKMMLCGLALAYFNIFAYWQLDKGAVWGPVRSLYGTYGPGKVMTILAAVSVLFLLGALVEKVKERDEDLEPYERPAPRDEPGDGRKYRWVDVD